MLDMPDPPEEQPSICRSNVHVILECLGDDQKPLRQILILALLRNTGVARLTVDMFDMTRDEAADIGAELDENMANTLEEVDLQYWLLQIGYWYPFIAYLDDDST